MNKFLSSTLITLCMLFNTSEALNCKEIWHMQKIIEVLNYISLDKNPDSVDILTIIQLVDDHTMVVENNKSKNQYTLTCGSNKVYLQALSFGATEKNNVIQIINFRAADTNKPFTFK